MVNSMKLPPQVKAAISAHIQQFAIQDIQAACLELTQIYAAKSSTKADLSVISDIHANASIATNTRISRSKISNKLQNLAYLATRMPATYAVAYQVLNMLRDLNFVPTQILDLGAGPGTVSLAALELFASVKNLTLLDKDIFFSEFALSILQSYSNSGIKVDYKLQDLAKAVSVKADLVTCSYVLNELSIRSADDFSDIRQMSELISIAWSATDQILVLIEPGTPAGFANIRSAREQLIAAGGHVLAPCTHENACPLLGTDWCHFPVRLERDRCHQQIKLASLGYEDEKYSYLIMAKHAQNWPRHASRVIKKPIYRAGCVKIDLCTASGIKNVMLSKRSKTSYKQARKLRWGDNWNDAFRGEEK